MFYIVCPANVCRYLEIVKPIVVYDLLPSTEISDGIWSFDYETQRKFQDELLDQMEDLGYQHHLSIIILGSLWMYISYYLFKLMYFFGFNYIHNTYFSGKDLEGGDIEQKWDGYTSQAK